MKKNLFSLVFLLLGSVFSPIVAQNETLNQSFSEATLPLTVIGRGNCLIKEGGLHAKDAYVVFGNSQWRNYSVQFKARAPKSEEQVQIWAGFRANNRNDRYVVGLRGGHQNSLYLSRMGYMGTDEFLGLAPLNFEPKPGIWYTIKIEVCGNRFRVFLNDDLIPALEVVDKNSALCPTGGITLGGSWITTEFDDLTITPLSETHLDQVAFQDKAKAIPKEQKEKQRVSERNTYKAIKVGELHPDRTEISMEGQWLFMPEQELNDSKEGANTVVNDENWHVMTVPNFWNPTRIWLHGESFEGHPKGVSDVYFQKETDRCKNYTFDYTTTKVAWYRQWIELPNTITSKHCTLEFDAVSKIAEVYINGQLAGSHIGMFGNFSVDASTFLQPGKNLIAVRVVRDFLTNIENGEKIVDVAVTVPVTNNMLKDIAHGFYKEDPAGIWQPVKLVCTNALKIEDVFIQPTLAGGTFEVTLKNYGNRTLNFALQTTINDKETGGNLHSATPLPKLTLKAGEERKFSFTIDQLKPRLWTPNHPNLYDFTFKIVSKNQIVDTQNIVSGFRTFEAKKGHFFLNGKQYWLRGANHTPFALAANDAQLATTFAQLMKAANIDVTRTHTAPYNELWMNAMDTNGIGVSYEGTWPWLMIKNSMPDQKLIDMWADEFIGLVKKYRNHPSILIWTVNNEMKFYDNEPDFEKAKIKMKIISDVVKRMRAIDPSRPISFDSNYKRNEKKFGKEFFTTIDDGDIDDDHKYINWYDYSIFKQFKGEFQKNAYNEGRPLISQEMSTGYPNAETGHATRFYNLVHQNPQSLIGYQSYEFGNPQAFLNVNAFITGELAEALRRSNDKASGILHFALLTWFRNVYDAQKIEPYPTYYAMKRALQQVLVSAELWGRNFYAGNKIPTKICVVNDLENGRPLQESTLQWTIETKNGEKIAGGQAKIPAVAPATRQWISPEVVLPEILPFPKGVAVLKLKLLENGIPISENEYELNLASQSWAASSIASTKKIALLDFNGIKTTLDFLHIPHKLYSNITALQQAKADLYIISGLELNKNCNELDLQWLRQKFNNGAKILLLKSPEATMKLFPEYITGWIVPTEGDIVNLEIPESKVFDEIGLFDVRYFNNNKNELPTVCNAAFKINRSPEVLELANQTKIHGYINGDMLERSNYVKTIKGFPLVKINKGGQAILSAMHLDKSETDPIAGRLLANMIQDLLQ
ncbi:glycoside hydrolase family 2 protein [Flavobacterium sp. TSSA_36]|uniref:glycoside hydrolase family 2 protein n=1 Tax=Flavobacterium sp. TSSA_36 TaxID=3447669 RepID=UPI003F33B58E